MVANRETVRHKNKGLIAGMTRLDSTHVLLGENVNLNPIIEFESNFGNRWHHGGLLHLLGGPRHEYLGSANKGLAYKLHPTRLSYEHPQALRISLPMI